MRRLDDPKYKLVISHAAGDEGFEYQDFLLEYAASRGVDMRIIAAHISAKREETSGPKKYTLWDVYPHADLVTYPSLYEGFGNAFLEAVYFHKPVLVNRYSIFVRDIEPKGFRTIDMNGYVTSEVVAETRQVLEDSEYRREMVERNYELAQRHFSFDVLERHLGELATNIFGLR